VSSTEFDDPSHEPLPLDDDLRAALARLGYEFQAEFLGIAVRTRDEDPNLISDLANALTRVGRFEEGLALDRRVVELDPDCPIARYNLACSLSLTGALDASLDELARAVDLGYCDYESARTDPDLEAVRARPEFADLFGRAS